MEDLIVHLVVVMINRIMVVVGMLNGDDLNKSAKCEKVSRHHCKPAKNNQKCFLFRFQLLFYYSICLLYLLMQIPILQHHRREQRHRILQIQNVQL
jgi:hypothetical protein